MKIDSLPGDTHYGDNLLLDPRMQLNCKNTTCKMLQNNRFKQESSKKVVLFAEKIVCFDARSYPTDS